MPDKRIEDIEQLLSEAQAGNTASARKFIYTAGPYLLRRLEAAETVIAAIQGLEGNLGYTKALGQWMEITEEADHA